MSFGMSDIDHTFHLCSLSLWLISLWLFAAQISNNIQEYLQHRTTVSVTTQRISDVFLPAITVCPTTPFHPLRLRNLGLNDSAEDTWQLEDRVDHLQGLDLNTPVRELLDKAGWRLGELVEEVSYGEVHEVYNLTTTSSYHWRRSFTYLGSCFTLGPLPVLMPASGRNLSIMLRKNMGIRTCDLGLKYNSTMQVITNENCHLIEEICNMSCTWYFYILTWHLRDASVFLESTSNSYNLFSFIPRALISNIDAFGRIFLLQEYDVIRPSLAPVSEDPQLHFDKCLVRVLEAKRNCTYISHSSVDKAVNEICVDRASLGLAVTFGKNFPSQVAVCAQTIAIAPVSRWYIVKEALYPEGWNKRRVVVKFDSVMKKFLEVAIYPLSKLLIDIGGSLGLFLGLSLLTLWEKAAKMVWSCLQPGEHRLLLRTLIHAGLVLLISIAAGLHFLLLILKYWYAVQTTSVAMDKENSTLPTTTLPGDSLLNKTTVQEMVAYRVASRSLHCLVKAKISTLHKCQVDCLLTTKSEEIVEILPFASIDDLSPCGDRRHSFPHTKFDIPDYIMNVAEDFEVLQECAEKCRNLKTNNSSTTLHLELKTSLRFRPAKFSCEFGGMVGLYFGWSFLGATDILRRGNRISHKGYRIVRLILVTLTVLMGIWLCGWQLLTYLWNHPVTFSTSILPVGIKDIPAVTVCRWPPFNLDKLRSTVTGSLSYSFESQSTATNIQQLTDMIATSQVPLDVLWSETSWTQDDITKTPIWVDLMGGKHGMQVTGARGLFNNCVTLRVDPVMKKLPTYYLVTPPSQLSSVLGIPLPAGRTPSSLLPWGRPPGGRFPGRPPMNPFMMTEPPKYEVFLHDPEDEPFPTETALWTDTVWLFFAAVSGMAKWTGRGQTGKQHGLCFSRCLNTVLARGFRCRLPSMINLDLDQTLPKCNTSDFATFLLDVWEFEPMQGDIYSALLASISLSNKGTRSRCARTCQGHKQTFYRFYRGSERVSLTSLRTVPSTKMRRKREMTGGMHAAITRKLTVQTPKEGYASSSSAYSSDTENLLKPTFSKINNNTDDISNGIVMNRRVYRYDASADLSTWSFRIDLFGGKFILEEYDAYPMSQLLSDLGGVGGITAGVSLLTVLLFGLQALRKLSRKF